MSRATLFFDLDGTIIFGYSIASIFYERVLSGQLSPVAAIQQFLSLVSHGISGTEYTKLLQEAAQTLVGVKEAEFRELGERVFERLLAGAIYPESRALIRAHQRRGHTVAILSSATPTTGRPSAPRSIDCRSRFGARCRRSRARLCMPACLNSTTRRPILR